MARISEVIVGENDIATFKCSSAVTDNDVNKPLKLASSDTLALAGDGEEVYGFLDSVDPTSEDGVAVVGVQKGGRKWVTMTGTYAVGDLVSADTNTGAGVALATTWGICKKHTYDTTTAITLAADLFSKNWIVIFGAGTDGTDALIELVA